MEETGKMYKEETKAAPDTLHIVLYVLNLTLVLFGLAEYGRMPFETTGTFFLHFSFAFFGFFLWVMQKVKLFNVPSLLTSIAYGVYAYFYIITDGKDAVTTAALIAETVSGWVFVMLLTDIAVTGRIRTNKKFHGYTFALLCVTAVMSLLYRDGGMAPFMMLYFVLMCFIPIGGKEWKKITDALLISVVIAFAALTVFSFIGDPFFHKDDDLFMTTGDLSQFYGLCLALGIFGIFYGKEKDGRFSPLYVFFCGFTLVDVIMIYAKGCVGIFPGAVLAVMVAIIFGYGVKPIKNFLIRLGIVLGVFLLMIAGIWLFARRVSAPGFHADAFAERMERPPFSYAGDAAAGFSEAVYEVQSGEGGYGSLVKPGTAAAFINCLTGQRLNIASKALKNIDWGGHVLSDSGDAAFVLGLRNQYVQYLYEFGYLAGGLNILLLAVMWVVSIVRYARYSRIRYLLPAILYAMIFGVWMNVSSGILYPIGFVGMLSLLPLFVDLKVVRHKVRKAAGKDVPSGDEANDAEEKDPNASDDTSEETSEEEEEEDMVEGRNRMAARFFGAKKPGEETSEIFIDEDEEEESPKKRKKKKDTQEGDEGENEVGRPTDRKSLEDVDIIDPSLSVEETEALKTKKKPTLNAAGQITEDILTLEELGLIRKMSEENQEENRKEDRE